MDSLKKETRGREEDEGGVMEQVLPKSTGLQTTERAKQEGMRLW